MVVMAKKRTEDRHAQPRYAFHASQELLDALELYCNESRPKVNKADAVRLALEEYLTKVGYWPKDKSEWQDGNPNQGEG